MDEKGLKILLVEDHRIVQKAMCIMLKNIGCEVDQVDCGSMALESFQNNYYNLILLDIGLPDIDGLTIAESMRKSQDPRKAKTPIVIISAHSDSGYKGRAYAIGIEDFIVKPFTPETRDKLIQRFTQVDSQPSENIPS